MFARRTGGTPETSRKTRVGVPPQTALPRRTTATPEPRMEAQEAYLACPPTHPLCLRSGRKAPTAGRDTEWQNNTGISFTRK